MQDKIKNKINELTKEAEQLVNQKRRLEQQVQHIEIRLTQIVGAINALQDLEENDEDSTEEDNES